MTDIKISNADLVVNQFFTAGSLKTHNHTIHQGLKNFRCESWGNLFSEASTLKKHIHGCKDRICDSCGKSFSYAHHLVGHIRTVHEGSIVEHHEVHDGH